MNNIPVLHSLLSQRPAYMLTVLPGLEQVAADEVLCKLNAPVRAVLRGKVFFTLPDASGASPYPFSDFMRLRSADNIYTYICAGEIGSTRNALTRLKELRVFDDYPTGATFTVNASVAGKHNYSRFEAAAAFAEGLEKNYHLIPGENHRRDIEFRLDIIDGQYMLFSKLTDAAFRFRGDNRKFTKAAIRPTVAHALVWISGPHDGETLLDPFCGSGTILCERAAYPFAALTGGDINATAAEQARLNLAGLQPPVDFTRIRLYGCGVGDLRLDASSVDTIVTNPPWDVQIPADTDALYAAFLRRAARWLRPGGTAIVLTPLREELLKAAGERFTFDTPYTVSLHGVISYVCVLRKI